MHRWFGRYNEIAYTILRVAGGFLFWCHAVQKLFGWFGGTQLPLWSLRGVAGMIEVVAGPMIAMGLFTSTAAFIASGEMAVAYFINHAPSGLLPIMNRGEPAAFFCFLFLYFSTRDSGRWSVDRFLRRARRGGSA